MPKISTTNRRKLQARGATALTIIAFFILLGTVAFHALEPWTWIQSFYFTVVTLATVGYGDLTPSSDGTRLFTAFFILMSVTIVLSSITYIGNAYLQARTEAREERKNGKRN